MRSILQIIKEELTKDSGKLYSVSEIENMVRDLHRNSDDFDEGDLTDRIYEFPYYKLEEIPIGPIDPDEFDLDFDLVREYMKRIKSGEEYPPIVYDPPQGSFEGSIIDGAHRTKALKKLGYKTIKAYVGVKGKR